MSVQYGLDWSHRIEDGLNVYHVLSDS